MFQSLLAVLLFLGPMSQAQAVRDVIEPPPTAQQAAATTQPASATEKDAIAVAPAPDTETLGQILGRTRVGKLFEGKTKVTLDDVKSPLFWIDTLKDLILALLGFIPRVIVAGLFLGFFWLIYRAVRKLVLGSLGSAGVDPSIRDMLGALLKWSMMGFGIVIACNQIGIQIAALLTGVSIIGLAVGFAAQETLANFIAGIVIFWDKPFKVGDWVEIEGTFGQVKRVTFRSTRILDAAGQYFVFPNTFMLSKKLSNYTTNPATKVTIEIGISYRESIEQARLVLLEMVRGDRRISTHPAPAVGVARYTAAGIDLSLSFWVDDESLARGLGATYLEKAKGALEQAGVQMSFQPAPPPATTPVTASTTTAAQPLRAAG